MTKTAEERIEALEREMEIRSTLFRWMWSFIGIAGVIIGSLIFGFTTWKEIPMRVNELVPKAVEDELSSSDFSKKFSDLYEQAAEDVGAIRERRGEMSQRGQRTLKATRDLIALPQEARPYILTLDFAGPDYNYRSWAFVAHNGYNDPSQNYTPDGFIDNHWLRKHNQAGYGEPNMRIDWKGNLEITGTTWNDDAVKLTWTVLIP